MHILMKLLLTVIVMLTTVSQTVFAKQLEGEALRANIIKRLPKLNHTKLQALMKRVGRDTPKGYYQCLCHSYSIMDRGIGYSANGTGGNCEKAPYPCIGGNWGCVYYPLPDDPKVIEHCMKSARYDDNSTIVDAIVKASKKLHAKTKYKKICDQAKIMFPLAYKKYLNNKTKILWDKKMLEESLNKAIKLYEKESNNKLSLNTEFGHADTYIPWLFGHGMSKFGGTFIKKYKAQQFSVLDNEETSLHNAKERLQNIKKKFKEKPGSKQSNIKELEKYWKIKEHEENEISKLEKKVNRLKYFRKNVNKGTEPALLDAIVKYKHNIGRKLTPGDVLYLALKQRNGKLNEALLLAHNTLRAIARPGQGDFGVTGVKGDILMYKDVFVTLREGDNAGPWYHIFGTGFYNVQQKTENIFIPSSVGSPIANAGEQFFREIKLPYIKEGRIPDPEKFCFNAWGAEIFGGIFNDYKLEEIVAAETRRKTEIMRRENEILKQLQLQRIQK